jgi:SAM-dependent methyltransferase
MPEPLPDALAQVRELLLGPGLVKAVASGRRRNAHPAHLRAELRPVLLKAGRRLQLVTTDGRHPITRNLDDEQAVPAVDALLAEPFGNWFVQTADQVWQLRVTKRGEAQVHRGEAEPAQAWPPAPPGPSSEPSPDAAADPSPDPAADGGRRVPQPAGHDRVKPRLLPDADPLFRALGAGADKRRQVEAFLRVLAPVADRAVEAAARAGRPLTVVDLGCGNAYLTFAAHRWLSRSHPDVRTVGVDARPEQIARNTRLAAELEQPGLSFVAGRIEDTEQAPGSVDLLLALHACDTATDDALALAVRWEVPVVLAAPCCHRDVQHRLTERWHGAGPPDPFGALARDGILRERFADVLTDTLRAALLRLLGHRVEVLEFVDSRHTPRNLMLRAIRTGAPADPRRLREFQDLAGFWGITPALAERLADLLADRLPERLPDPLTAVADRSTAG